MAGNLFCLPVISIHFPFISGSFGNRWYDIPLQGTFLSWLSSFHYKIAHFVIFIYFFDFWRFFPSLVDVMQSNEDWYAYKRLNDKHKHICTYQGLRVPRLHTTSTSFSLFCGYDMSFRDETCQFDRRRALCAIVHVRCRTHSKMDHHIVTMV